MIADYQSSLTVREHHFPWYLMDTKELHADRGGLVDFKLFFTALINTACHHQ